MCEVGKSWGTPASAASRALTKRFPPSDIEFLSPVFSLSHLLVKLRPPAAARRHQKRPLPTPVPFHGKGVARELDLAGLHRIDLAGRRSISPAWVRSRRPGLDLAAEELAGRAEDASSPPFFSVIWMACCRWLLLLDGGGQMGADGAARWRKPKELDKALELLFTAVYLDSSSCSSLCTS